MSSEDFKNPVPDTNKQEVLTGMANEPNQILQVDTITGKLQLLIDSVKAQQLIVYPRVATALDLTGEHKVQWVFNRSRYECTAQFSNEKQGLYAIDFHKPIYKIQRRQNFRTIIPSQWKNEIRIHLRNDQSFNIKGLIIDISLNGCYFEIQTSNPLTNNDSITGEIEIADFKVLKFSGKIVRKSTMANGFGYGIHFLNIENFGKEILNNITLKAARAMRDYTQD